MAMSKHDPNPFADREMRELIDKAFHKDMILDAAIDVLLSRFGPVTSDKLLIYLFYPDYIDDESLGIEIEAAKKVFRDTVEDQKLLSELDDDDINELSDDNINKLGDNNFKKLQVRIEKRHKLLHGDEREWAPHPDVPQHADTVLDAAVEILEQPGSPSAQWPEVPLSGTMSLQQNAEVSLLDQLSAAVSGERASATFACGGKVSITGNQDTDRSGIDDRRLSPSIDVRWDSTLSEGRVVRFPITTERPQRDSDAFQQLLLDCQPAMFGRGGKDVFDESYRKAGKLDATRFCTSFDPYEFGIVDAVAQVLLPGIPFHSMTVCPEHLGVSAELYNLNIYSGPFGCLGPHVGTPRSHTHFASLVVCLPSPHQGGALVVRHGGNQLVFDWSSIDPFKIGWAAFYSDCEHEVEQMQSGYRVTLAYNLYVMDRVGWTLQQPNPIVDPSQMVLYEMLKDMLAARAFMSSGGVLGVFCSHEYAHTNDSAQRRLPRALKGVDFAVYAAFKALGLPVKVAPTIEIRGGYGGISLRDLRANGGLEVSKSAREHLRKCQEQGDKSVCLEYEGEDLSDGESTRKHICRSDEYSKSTANFESHLNHFRASRRVKGLTKRRMTRKDVTVGTCFQETAYHSESYDFDDIIDNHWPHVTLPIVTWLNEAIEGTDEIQMAQLAYGDETFIKCRYSAAAIFVVVPKYADRNILPSPEKNDTTTRKRDYEAFQED